MSVTGKCMFMATSDFNFINTAKTNFVLKPHNIPTVIVPHPYRIMPNNLYEEFEGMELYREFSKFIDTNVAWVDRSQTLTTPFNVNLPEFLKLPEYKVSDKSYADCCDERAKELLSNHRTLLVFYSGGIDSTTMLSSLMRNSSKEDSDKIKIVMTSESITQNPSFYQDKILCKYDVIPAQNFTKYIGDDNYLCVFGEHNDEIFGTQFLRKIVFSHEDISNQKPSKELLKGILFTNIAESSDVSFHTEQDNCIELMMQVCSKSPVELDTINKYFWWLNLCLKWNVSYMRYLGFNVNNRETLKLEENYTTFFGTKDFQLWSMNNLDKHSLYKQEAKEYIYNFHQDDTYRNHKIKSSKSNFCLLKPMTFAIDTDGKYYDEVTDSVLNPNNSFNL